MNAPSEPELPADVPHRLWLLQRLARGLAHELANVQQLLLAPELPADAREDADVRLGRVADTLSAWGHQSPDEPASPLPVRPALASAASLHALLGGEPRLRLRIAVDGTEPAVVHAPPSVLERALVSLLVIAGRLHDRRSGHELVLSAATAGDAVRLGLDMVPANDATLGDEERWLREQSARLLARLGGALEPATADGRVAFRAWLPRIRAGAAPRP